MTVIPKIIVDEDTTTHTLTTINSTNFANGERNAVIRPNNVTGQHSFYLGLEWSGTALCTIALPIEIEYETIDD